MRLCIITQQTTSGRLRLLSPLSHQAPYTWRGKERLNRCAFPAAIYTLSRT